jgi:hypothetical protein
MTPCQEKHYKRKMAYYNEQIRRCQLVIKVAVTVQDIERQEDRIKYFIGLINQLKAILKEDIL